MKRKALSKAQVGAKYGFRSGLEVKVAQELDALEVPYSYEQYKLKYEVPARVATYTPDYVLPNGIIIETKGRFLTADRQKHLLVKNDHPGIDIRFVFSNANTRISKQSKTTYAVWCMSHGFLFASKSIPTDWLEEAPTAARMEALKSLIPVTKKASK